MKTMRNSSSQRIRVAVDVPGVGVEYHEWDYCPIRLRFGDRENTCPFMPLKCHYGLTEIKVPGPCPIKLGTLRMDFILVEETEEKNDA
jgi:hypothetical protein